MTTKANYSRLKKLQNKSYRDTYLDGYVKSAVANQVYALRHQSGETQGKFAKRIGATQASVSRLEDEEYGNVTVNTLLNVAKGANVGLLVKFVSYPEMLGAFAEGFDPESLAVESVDISLTKSYEARGQSIIENDFRVSGLYSIFEQINETLTAGVFATFEVGKSWQPKTIDIQPPPLKEVALLTLQQPSIPNQHLGLEMKTLESTTPTSHR